MNNEPSQRWCSIRSNLIFQVKLTVDALRDVLLSPVAIICTLCDLVKGHKQQQSYFQRLMDLGHKSDHWLNLFGENLTKQNAQKKPPVDANSLPNASAEKTSASVFDQEDEKPQQDSINLLFSKAEQLLKEQHQQGGLTASAKQKIDFYLNKLSSQDLFNYPRQNQAVNQEVRKTEKNEK